MDPLQILVLIPVFPVPVLDKTKTKTETKNTYVGEEDNGTDSCTVE